MARRVHVELGERSYDIVIGRNIRIGTVLKQTGATGGLLVSDSNIDPVHGDACQAGLESIGLEVARLVIPAGEQSKSMTSLCRIYDRALELGLDRFSFMVALGGGMIGDLVGFAAATYMRGIALAQVPTSMLAMVDSSVGGKTGVNLEQGKNLVGSFYQPVEVAVDLALLETLPEREFVSGLAEVVKYGVIDDFELFELIEANVDGVLQRSGKLLEQIVARCCEIKAGIVSEDEREGGRRAILNFGHTFGHALENAEGYGRLLHGEALAVGMVYAAELSAWECGLPVDQKERISKLLRSLGLPVSPADAGMTWNMLREKMTADKKTRASVPRFVLAEGIGSVIIGRTVSEEVLAEAFEVLVCRA